MGAKGPIFILIFGIGALVAFGLMGKFLLTESDQAQASVRFRSELVEQFGFDRVEVRREGDATTVVGWGGAPLPEGDDQAARVAATVAQGFRRGYSATKLPDQLVVSQVQKGGGCRADEERWRAEFDFDADRRRVLGAIEKRVGRGSTLEVKEDDQLAFVLPRGTSDSLVGMVAQELATLWGGGWAGIDVRLGGRVHRFDGAGKAKPR